MDQSENQQSIGAGGDADELVRYCRVARPYGIDRDDLGAAFLEAPKTELDRIGIVIFGDTDQQEELRKLPVGLAEFPEGAADGVGARGSHVHRAEPAMGGVVDRADERLRLMPTSEEGELIWIGLADAAQSMCRDR